MQNSLTLSKYVKQRNGVPLGAKRSMRNMLYRSFGARSFAQFWRHWNPIWSYYLSRNVMRPLNAFLPTSLSVLITFLISGALHDLAVSVVKWKAVVFFTPWFGIMGTIVIGFSALGISYDKFRWIIRATFNFLTILCSLGIAYLVESMYVL